MAIQLSAMCREASFPSLRNSGSAVECKCISRRIEEKQARAAEFCPLYSSLRSIRVSSSSATIPALRSMAASNGSVSVDDTAPPVRIGREIRNTKETKVDVSIGLDGTGNCDCDTGIPFLDHMLDQIASHGLFDLSIKAVGDTHIDDHHTNEDVALAFGTALARAIGNRSGIHRYGDFSVPLDEALVHVVVDLCGRPCLRYTATIPTQRVGQYDTQLVEHFFQSLCNTSGMTLHIRQLDGTNSHHIIEAMFKAFARALRQACEPDPRRIGKVPSSKGVLSRM
ncbi:imidazoleglycerol-phosphate dehydratase [Selaginella moellendorffii]|nr:imidazoleglycerol-phosphate dehydratase [Selaginella moellendorffii]|eukprot:XP_002967461.2 imidazoleglycerol-phosphate dehydratase [Selaginella moellendorffii]